MGFAVRLATAADAPELAALEDQARTALIDQRGGQQLLAEQPAEGEWLRPLTDECQRVWVATIDDVPVGYLQLVLPGPDRTARVRQVYVVPEARELGFGDDLLAAAMTAAADAGAHSIESFALPGDRDTKNLYERAGVTARKLIVSKRL